MKLPRCAILLMLAPFVCGPLALAEEFDPFAQTAPADEEQVTPKEFETTGATKFAPVTGQNPEIVPRDDWGWRNLEKIEEPTSFNRKFDAPPRIWRVDDRIFIAPFTDQHVKNYLGFQNTTDGDKTRTEVTMNHQHLLDFFPNEEAKPAREPKVEILQRRQAVSTHPFG